MLSNPDLLNAYRTHITPIAQVWLDENNWQHATQSAWLTKPGFIATLHHAQTLIESAHFRAGIRILDELQTHPDAPAFSDQTTKLVSLAEQYLNAKQPNARPSPAVSLSWNTDQSTDPISLTGIVPGALANAALTPKPELEHLQGINQPRLTGANWNPTSWIMPVVANNMLYTNDGVTISCFDRFTLRPVWRLQTAIDTSSLPISDDARARIGRIIEDTTTLTIVNNDLYAPAGLPRNGSRVGDTRLLKINASTGDIQWAIDIRDVDPSLADASIRGQIIVDQGVVIVGARTNNRKKRLITLAIIGLDATTGNTLWVRQIASAGSLPFQQMGQLAHSPVLHNGIIYWTDHIGLGFAIESATGQVLWAKPLPPPDLYARFARPSFSNNTPAITKHGLFTLTTDGTKILQLDLTTGQTIATQPANPVGESLYLLAVNDSIACVSSLYVTIYSAERFATATTSRSPILGGSADIRGRVVVINNQLIVPIESGVQVIDASHPQAVHKIDLDASGNILALNGQLIVVDEMNISSYLAWDTASTMLQGRIADDPAAAITLAELAYRAHRTNDTVNAVVRAMAIVAKEPLASRGVLHDQLFVVVLDMVEPSHANQTTAQTPSETTNQTTNTTLSSSDQRTLLSHLETLAQSHQQVVAHRMALGAWNEQRNNMPDAIGAYQDILDQPALSASMWEGAGIAVRGGLEASRRIGSILDAAGYTPYRKFDQLALAEHSFVDESINPTQLEQLAKRFPWATSTPTIWLEASKLWNTKDQAAASINAAKKGLDATQSLIALGVHTEQSTVDQLAEQAITGMIATNRAKDAQKLASSLSQSFPNLTLRIAGEIITNDQIAIKAQLAAQVPVLGEAFIRDAQPLLLTGSPIKPAIRIDQGGIVLHAPQLGRIEYVRAGRGAFETIWSRQSKTMGTPIIPWQDHKRTVILWAQDIEIDDTGTLEAIETTTGRVVWSIEDIRTTIANKSTRIADDLARNEGQFATPVQGTALTTQLLIVTDGHTLIVSDRIGRAMGIDLFTGKQLWHIDLPANRLYDIDLNAGVLGICGIQYTDQPTQQQEGLITSIAASIDARTGETIGHIDRIGQFPRWVRVGDDGNLFVATTQRIVAINTKEGTLDWVFKDDALEESKTAWIAGDQLIVLDFNADLWALSLGEGTHESRPLDLRERITQRGWVQLHPTINAFSIASSRGFTAFDEHQNLVAVDPLKESSDLIDVAWGQRRVVFIAQSETIDDQSQAKLYLLDQHDARLLDTISVAIPSMLGRHPTSLTAIAGGVIVGYNEVSIFVRTKMIIQ